MSRRPAAVLIGGLLLAGCTGEVGQPERNAVRVELVLADVPRGEEDEELVLDLLTVRIDEIVIEGEGPEGEVSVSQVAGAEQALIGGTGDAGTPWLELPAGEWRELELEVVLRAAGSTPALDLEAEVDEQAVVLAVRDDVVELEGELDTLVLDSGADTVLQLELDPALWFEGLDLESAATVGEVVVLHDPRNGISYGHVLDRIEETTVLLPPGVPR